MCQINYLPQIHSLILKLLGNLEKRIFWGQIPKTRENMFFLCCPQQMLYRLSYRSDGSLSVSYLEELYFMIRV